VEGLGGGGGALASNDQEGDDYLQQQQSAQLHCDLRLTPLNINDGASYDPLEMVDDRIGF